MPAINISYNPQEREASDESSTRRLNLVKKWFRCLKCGGRMFTDRCHRICRKCHQRNEKTRNKHQYPLPNERGAYSSPRDLMYEYDSLKDRDEIIKDRNGRKVYSKINGNSSYRDRGENHSALDTKEPLD